METEFRVIMNEGTRFIYDKLAIEINRAVKLLYILKFLFMYKP